MKSVNFADYAINLGKNWDLIAFFRADNLLPRENIHGYEILSRGFEVLQVS